MTLFSAPSLTAFPCSLPAPAEILPLEDKLSFVLGLLLLLLLQFLILRHPHMVCLLLSLPSPPSAQQGLLLLNLPFLFLFNLVLLRLHLPSLLYLITMPLSERYPTLQEGHTDITGKNGLQ